MIVFSGPGFLVFVALGISIAADPTGAFFLTISSMARGTLWSSGSRLGGDIGQQRPQFPARGTGGGDVATGGVTRSIVFSALAW
jgi:hypothetical protein